LSGWSVGLGLLCGSSRWSVVAGLSGRWPVWSLVWSLVWWSVAGWVRGGRVVVPRMRSMRLRAMW